MNVTVKRSQPRPVIGTVTITLTMDEARVLKLLATYRSPIIDILAERLSNGEVPYITTAHASAVLKRMWDALHEVNIQWSTR